MSRLGNIAKIKTGYNINRRSYLLFPSSTLRKKRIKVVLPKDIAMNGKIDISHLNQIPFNELKDEYFLKANDILFVGKGSFNVALVEKEINAIPASSFYKIKVVDKNFTTKYVDYFLNFLPRYISMKFDPQYRKKFLHNSLGAFSYQYFVYANNKVIIIATYH